MILDKAYLLAERRATRDYLDVAALALHLGEAASLKSLAAINNLYSEPGSQTAATRFSEACEADPVDPTSLPLDNYRGLRKPFTDWNFMVELCRRMGRNLIKLEMNDGFPSSEDKTKPHEP